MQHQIKALLGSPRRPRKRLSVRGSLSRQFFPVTNEGTPEGLGGHQALTWRPSFFVTIMSAHLHSRSIPSCLDDLAASPISSSPAVRGPDMEPIGISEISLDTGRGSTLRLRVGPGGAIIILPPQAAHQDLGLGVDQAWEGDGSDPGIKTCAADLTAAREERELDDVVQDLLPALLVIGARYCRAVVASSIEAQCDALCLKLQSQVDSTGSILSLLSSLMTQVTAWAAPTLAFIAGLLRSLTPALAQRLSSAAAAASGTSGLVTDWVSAAEAGVWLNALEDSLQVLEDGLDGQHVPLGPHFATPTPTADAMGVTPLNSSLTGSLDGTGPVSRAISIGIDADSAASGKGN